MTRNVILAATLVGGLAMGAGTAHALGGIRSAEVVGKVHETYKMALEIRSDGSSGAPKRVDDDRVLLHVPAHFGDILTVTGHPDADVIWYRDEAGTLRNVVIDLVTTRAVRLQSADSDVTERRYR